ncbi:MAG: PBSX family phage terminase large subunit [Eubacteriales bacterium]|nr:PBSX family phage terminase large subunit [Eubacteriales bacterium]
MGGRLFTDKQRTLMRMWQIDRLKRINLLEGSVRSGKTWVSLVLWAFWVATMPLDGHYLMVAKTLTTLRRNTFDQLINLVGSDNFEYSLSKKEGFLFGRRVFFEGVNDMSAENKIRGMTLTGAYCDEVSLFNEDFFTMLLSRLSVEGAKLFATTNPDNPNHWLKKNYIDRADNLDMVVMTFLIDDNTFLKKDYIDNIKKEYTGVYYDRFILGRWKAAEGCVYPLFADNPQEYIIQKPPDDVEYLIIGVDFGGNNSAHSFVATGYTKGLKKLIAIDEYYHKGKISPSQLEDAFIQFIKKQLNRYPVYEIYCDSAETTLIQGLINAVIRERLPVDVRNARKGRINDRICFFNYLMSHKRFYVTQSCPQLIDALQNAVWNQTTNEDKRLDDGTINIDSLDALEYSAEVNMNDMMQI